MSKKTEYKLTPEEIAAGVTIGDGSDVGEYKVVDVTDKNLEKMAQGFIMGTQSIGKRRDIQRTLEEKVIGKIGRKGKYLTDKLFELIEGIYIEQKVAGAKRGATTIRYYKVPPNLQAIIYALDRVLGKPKQTVDKTEEKKGIILVEHVIRNLAQNPYRDVRQNGVQGSDTGGEEGGGDDGAGSLERQPEGVGAGAV